MANIQERISRDGATSYRVQIRRKGYPTQSKTFETLQQAEDWAYDTERDIRDRRVDPRALGTRKTLRHAVELYLAKIEGRHKSYKDTAARCNHFKDKLGSVPLADLNPIMIDECVDALGCSGPTQNRYLGALSGCLGFVSRTPYNWISVNPCKSVTRREENRARERTITPAEWKQLLAYVDKRAVKGKSREKQLPTYLRLAYATGRRRGELLKLRWDCVDLEEGVLYLLDTKTGDDNVVPIDKDMVKLLKNHAKAHQVEGWSLVFRGRFPDKVTNFDDLARDAIRAMFKPDRRGEMPVFHSLRHTAATELGEAGATEVEIMSVTGHKTSVSVQRYVKKTVGAARAAQAKRGKRGKRGKS